MKSNKNQLVRVPWKKLLFSGRKFHEDLPVVRSCNHNSHWFGLLEGLVNGFYGEPSKDISKDDFVLHQGELLTYRSKVNMCKTICGWNLLEIHSKKPSKRSWPQYNRFTKYNIFDIKRERGERNEVHIVEVGKRVEKSDKDREAKLLWALQ